MLKDFSFVLLNEIFISSTYLVASVEVLQGLESPITPVLPSFLYVGKIKTVDI